MPYYGQGGPRGYARSSSSSSIPLLDSAYGGGKRPSADGRGQESSFASYFRSKYIIPEDGPASSYLAPRYKSGLQGGYHLKRYGSTDNVLAEERNATGFARRYNAPEASASNALSTASRPKGFDCSLPPAKEDKVLGQREPVVRKFAGKSGGPSSYVNQYLARINRGRDVRPREIDTRDIDTSEKPKNAKWLKPDHDDEGEGLISRNRQVVRLTIKREKEAQDPFVIRDRTLQTIAQRLVDKYQLPEKKPEPPAGERTRGLPREGAADPPRGKPPSEASAVRLRSPSTAPSAPPCEKEEEEKEEEEEEEEKGEDAARRLLRATDAAESKKELENWEEVKDAIYAAVLSPDVDLESDEEMEKLVEGDSGCSPGRGGDGSEEGKGRAVVGQLKRFVQQQESVKGQTKERSSARSPRKSRKSRRGQGRTDASGVDGFLIARGEENKVREEALSTDACSADEVSSRGVTDSVEKQERVGDAMAKLSRCTSPPDCPTKADETQGKSKTLTAPQTEPEHRVPRAETVEPKLANAEREQRKLSAKATKRDKSSLLSPDLVFNAMASDDNKKAQTKAMPPTGLKKAENRKCELEESNRRSKNGVKKVVSEELCTKPDETVGSSVLSADLVLTSLTSDEKKTKRAKPKPENKVSELEKSNSKPSSDEKEQTRAKVSTKIPKLKKKKKEVEESYPGLQDSRAPGPVSQGQSASEEASKPQALPPSDVPRQQHSRKEDEGAGGQEMSAKGRPTPKKCSTEASVPLETRKKPAGAFLAQSSQNEEAVEVESSKKDSRDANKDLKETCPVLTISKFDEEGELKGGIIVNSRDERAVEMEISKTNRNADKHNRESCPVFKLSKSDEREKLKDRGTQRSKDDKGVEMKSSKNNKNADKDIKVLTLPKCDEKERRRDAEAQKQTIEKLQETKEVEKEKILFNDKSKPPEENNLTKPEEKKMTDATVTASEIPRKITEAASTTQENNLNGLKEMPKVEDGAKREGKAEKTTKKIEEGEGKGENTRRESPKETMNGNEASRGSQASPDATRTKKPLKKPRQVLPPPEPEKPIGNEYLNARNVLKRPFRQIPAGPDKGGGEETDAPAAAPKKVWKRPAAPSAAPNQGDLLLLLQARGALKRPSEPREEGKAGKREEAAEGDAEEEKEGRPAEARLKRLAKKPAAGSQADDEGGRARALKKKQKHVRSRSASSSSSSSSSPDGGSTVRKKVGRPKRPPKPSPAASGRPSPASPKPPPPPPPPAPVGQSADSGYGSSPSTPQPTAAAAAAAGAGDEEACAVCGTNCHKKCEKQMPNLCGVNQKLLAEALSSVKKGGGADGTTRTLGPPAKASPSVSGSETEATEDEAESSTDTDSDFFGPPEIRAPIQTCLKFKKYSVDDFDFVKVLGKGSYGKVMLAQQKDSENYFAVKCLKKDVVLEDNDIECTLIERKVLSLGTKHPYLCHLFCTFQTPSHLFFVMEYLTGGDLMFHIQHCGRFDEFRACFYAAEITSGLKFLHSKGIIYRDLKLDNILLDYQGHIRIADFGMCKLQVYLDRYADTFCGTPDYMAPEVIKGLHYNQCVDWWSFGVLLYEMLTGKSPFKGCDEDHLFWLICNDEPFFPKFLSKEATQILKQLLDKDSTRRLGIPFSPYGEITVHPFFKYIDWHKIERKEVETPYKPRLRHILDVQYFDPLFTKRHAAITPLDESILTTMDQTAFRDFSYTNPNITD